MCEIADRRVRLQRVQLLRGGRRSFSGSGSDGWSADAGAGYASPTAGESEVGLGRGWVQFRR